MSEIEKIDLLVKVRRDVNFKIENARKHMREFSQARTARVVRSGKKVSKIDIHNGKVIDTYPSLISASVSNDIDVKLIRRCCNGVQEQSRGFKWEFSN